MHGKSDEQEVPDDDHDVNYSKLFISVMHD